MAQSQRLYDHEYRVQAVKLTQELGSYAKVANELGIPKDTVYGWAKAVREGRLDMRRCSYTKERSYT